MNEDEEKKPQLIGDVLKNIVSSPKVKSQRIHSKEHELAKQICEHFKEKKFALWLGVIKRYGFDNVRREWKSLMDYPKPYTAKLLMWQMKNKYAKKPKE